MTHAAHRLTDLIDIGQLQRLCDGLSESGADGLGVLEPDGTVLVSSGWQDICALFHRSNEVTRQACHESDLRVNQHVLDNLHAPTHIVYTCPHGLTDLAFPLVVDGEHLANIYTGQFFFDDDDVDVEEFRERARRVGFDQAAYLDAVARVPRIPHQRAEQTIRFMAQFVSMLAELGLGALEQQRSHEALRISEERYRDLAEDMPASICVFQPDGTFTYANSAAASSEGTTPEGLVGQNLFDFVTPKDAVMLRHAMDSLTPSTPVETHEQTQPGPDGGTRWQRWTNRAFFDADGHVLRYQAVGYDITQRKLDEEAVRTGRQQYETFLNATDDMAFLKDEDLKYVIVNQANARFFGKSVQEVVGCTDADLMSPEATRACHDSDVAALERQLMVVSLEAADGRVYE
ncbi:MAG TPA: PocR ligand-binding domain-containing protein, partial [Coriobacteriia bacterium]